jgi:hypothetical protein
MATCCCYLTATPNRKAYVECKAVDAKYTHPTLPDYPVCKKHKLYLNKKPNRERIVKLWAEREKVEPEEEEEEKEDPEEEEHEEEEEEEEETGQEDEVAIEEEEKEVEVPKWEPKLNMKQKDLLNSVLKIKDEDNMKSEKKSKGKAKAKPKSKPKEAEDEEDPEGEEEDPEGEEEDPEGEDLEDEEEEGFAPPKRSLLEAGRGTMLYGTLGLIAFVEEFTVQWVDLRGLSGDLGSSDEFKIALEEFMEQNMDVIEQVVDTPLKRLAVIIGVTGFNRLQMNINRSLRGPPVAEGQVDAKIQELEKELLG